MHQVARDCSTVRDLLWSASFQPILMSQPTVLVVDDEAGIRESLRRLLQRAGWLPLTAASPSEAIAALANGSAVPDAAILDLRMPDGNGLTSGLKLLAHLRAQQQYQQLPVILLTGRFLTEDEEADARRHHAIVLYKPAELQTIAELLVRLRHEAWEGAL